MTRPARTRSQHPLRLLALEQRLNPTTNILLDFDGGTLATGQGYDYVPDYGSTFTAFKGFNLPTTNAAQVRTEQILQILAGVRQDYADFDVNVTWDDRGVNSPFYTNTDTVVQIVAEAGEQGLYGISPSADKNSTTRDVCLVFEPTHSDTTVVSPGLPYRRLREITDTISHEVGHSFGLEHAITADKEGRQLCTTATQNSALDSRFSSALLNHELGGKYSERTFLFNALGPRPAGQNLAVDEQLTNQPLTADTKASTVPAGNLLTLVGTIPNGTGTLTAPLRIDYAGDRDAVQLKFTAAGTYVIRQRPTADSGVVPALTVWSDTGGFLSAGTGDVVSAATVTVTAGQTLFAIAGTSFDRLGSGVSGAGSVGSYNVEVTPVWAELNSITSRLTLTAPAAASTIGLSLVGTNFVATMNGGSMTVPASAAGKIAVFGGAGSDSIQYTPAGLPGLTITGGGGADTVAVTGSGVDDTFAFEAGTIRFNLAAPVPLAGIAALALDGGAGNDRFVIAASPATAVAVVGGAGTDTLGVSGTPTLATGVAGSGTYTYTPGGPQPVTYSGIETLDNTIVPTRPPVKVVTGDVAYGAGVGADPLATLFAADRAKLTVMAFDPAFRGGVRTTAGDFTGDGVADLVAAAGPGGGPHVRIFDGVTGLQLAGPLGNFFPYDPGFRGGAFVAAMDINADGFADLITGAGEGGGPHVQVFDGKTGARVRSFFAYDPAFRGGVRVAAGDVNGDRVADIVTGAGPGGGPHVLAYDTQTLRVVQSFFAFDPALRTGVYVAAGDVNRDGKSDVLVGQNEGGGATLQLRDSASGFVVREFEAFLSPGFNPANPQGTPRDFQWSAGVRVGLADVDGDGRADILAAPGVGRAGRVRIFDPDTLNEQLGLTGTDPVYLGGSTSSRTLYREAEVTNTAYLGGFYVG